MKISYTHPITQKRTSITLGSSMLRLYAAAHSYDVESDDFMFDPIYRAELQKFITELTATYAPESTTFPTFISYVENAIALEAISLITQLKNA